MHLILDCDNLAYIARHAFGSELSHEEEETGVMWGFLNSVFRLANKFDTHKFIFAWDCGVPLRKMQFPEYKENRNKGDDFDVESHRRVKEQFKKLRDEILPTMGFRNIFFARGIEADDIIARLVESYDWPKGITAVSTDKDLYQLLHFCDIYRPLPGDKKELMTKKLFFERYRITSEQWLVARTMDGDSSDNISGVPGVGLITAIKYIKGELPNGTIKTTIQCEKGQLRIRRNERLMALPHPQTPDFDYVPFEQFSLDAFLEICDKYAFNSFLKPEMLKDWRTRFQMGQVP